MQQYCAHRKIEKKLVNGLSANNGVGYSCIATIFSSPFPLSIFTFSSCEKVAELIGFALQFEADDSTCHPKF